jgi:hypothetical protein
MSHILPRGFLVMDRAVISARRASNAPAIAVNVRAARALLAAGVPLEHAVEALRRGQEPVAVVVWWEERLWRWWKE